MINHHGACVSVLHREAELSSSSSSPFFLDCHVLHEAELCARAEGAEGA